MAGSLVKTPVADSSSAISTLFNSFLLTQTYSDSSEEFLNFERGVKHALGLNKEQVQEVIRKSPPPKDEDDRAENS